MLIVESEYDEIVSHPAIASYLASLSKSHSLTYRVIAGADHRLHDESCKRAYTSLLINWATEMVFGLRERGMIETPQ